MKLLTKEILNQFAKQGYTGDKQPEDVKIILKVFNPCGGQTWYLYEYEPNDRIFMGYVNLNDPICAELGSVSLDELESLRLPMGMKLERDMYFGFEHTLKEVIEKTQNGEHI